MHIIDHCDDKRQPGAFVWDTIPGVLVPVGFIIHVLVIFRSILYLSPLKVAINIVVPKSVQRDELLKV